MKKLSLLLLLITVFSGTVLFSQNDSIENLDQAKKEYPEYEIAFEKMNAEQALEAIEIIEGEKARIEKDKGVFGVTGALAVTAPFVLIILVVFIIYFYRHKTKKDLNILLSKYIEAGKEIPVELITNPEQPRNDLRKGLVSGFTGIAIVILGFIQENDLLFFGMVPLFVGIAFILSHFLIKKADENK